MGCDDGIPITLAEHGLQRSRALLRWTQCSRDTWDLRTDHLKEPSPIRHLEEINKSSLTSIRNRDDVPKVQIRVQHLQIRKLYLLWIVSLSDRRSSTIEMLLI